jgi:hypothetical protein
MRHPVPDPVAGRVVQLRQFASSRGDRQTCEDFPANLWSAGWVQMMTESSSKRTAFVARAVGVVVPVVRRTSKNPRFNLTHGTESIARRIRSVVHGEKGILVAILRWQMTSQGLSLAMLLALLPQYRVGCRV